MIDGSLGIINNPWLIIIFSDDLYAWWGYLISIWFE